MYQTGMKNELNKIKKAKEMNEAVVSIIGQVIRMENLIVLNY